MSSFRVVEGTTHGGGFSTHVQGNRNPSWGIIAPEGKTRAREIMKVGSTQNVVCAYRKCVSAWNCADCFHPPCSTFRALLALCPDYIHRVSSRSRVSRTKSQDCTGEITSQIQSKSWPQSRPMETTLLLLRLFTSTRWLVDDQTLHESSKASSDWK